MKRKVYPVLRGQTERATLIAERGMMGGSVATVYFGTNRRQTSPLSFGAVMGPPDRAGLICAEATVEGVTLENADSGRITAIMHETATGFAPATRQSILGSGNDLLIFIHGFANAFESAISRAAYNRDWFASSPVAAADMTVIAFTWPSEGALIAAPPHFLGDAYRADQARAGASGVHLAWFFDEIKSIGDEVKQQNPRRRVVLLAHSMGNYVLAAGVQAWFTTRDPTAIFDHAVLAAADEIDKSFEMPAGVRLSRLSELSGGLSVYYSLRDVAMYLSQAINLTERLGFDGPAHKSDRSKYPPERFRSVNCTELNDYDRVDPPDSSHQYYRRSRKARDDIAQALTGGPVQPGESTLA